MNAKLNALLITQLLLMLSLSVLKAQPYCDQAQSTAGFPLSPECESEVCDQDFFCCTSGWDTYCATLAITENACMNCLNGSQYSFLSGSVFVDYDCDGIVDTEDFGVFDVEIQNFGTEIGYVTFPDGAYEIPLPINSDYAIAPENLPGVNLVSPHLVSTSDQSESWDGVDFGLCPIPDYYDIQVDITGLQNWQTPNPWASGTQRNLLIKVLNQGPYFSGGQLIIEFPDQALQVIQDGGGTVTAGEIIVDIDPINPYGSDYTSLSFLLSEDTPYYELYNLNIAVILDSGLPQDQIPANNEVSLDFMVADIDGNVPYCDYVQPYAGFPSDPVCEEAICGFDSFCCSTSWDAICVSFVLEEPACINCIYEGNNIVVEGKVYLDLNCNEVCDGEDVLIPYANIFRNGNLTALTNSSGNYAFVAPMWDDVNVSTQSYYGFQMNPVQLATQDSSIVGVDFALCPVGEVVNLGVYISQVGLPPRPGFDFEYEVCVQNFGNSITDGIITFDFSGMPGIPLVDAGDGIVDGTEITFYAEDIGIFETVCFPITFHVPEGTSVGTTLTAAATVETMSELITDQSTHNNYHEFISVVVGAYDPNDKTVNKPVVNHTEIEPGEGAELEYVIRFQNTGNFFATFVRVEDVLPDLLDLNTLEMIHASHDYELIVHDDQHIEWFFDNIMLPDSTTDEPGSHGQIHFRITTVPGVQLEDVIENSASIFFDFKEPVITEPAITTFIDCSEGSLSIEVPEVICEGEAFELTTNRPDFDNYSWTINGQDFSGSEIEYTTFLEDEVNAELVVTNEVCTLSTEMQVSVSPHPFVPVIPEGFTVCGVGEELELGAVGSVSWYLDDELVATGDPVVLPESGVYYIVAENECGVADISTSVHIVDVPDEVTLTFNGEQLVVEPEGSDHYWFFEGSMIEIGGPEFAPTESGNYSVEVFFEDSWCNLSSDMVFVPVSINEQLDAQITLYPNPAKDFVTIELPQGQWQLNLMDAVGKSLQSVGNITDSRYDLQLKDLAPGAYFVQLISDEGFVVKKLVVD